MFTAPDHQVAGHQARDGQLGPLIDSSGRFYKPLQTNGRGSQELAFYQSFSSNPRIPNQIRNFFPKFFGTKILEASDGSGPRDHLILEDLTVHLINPSIADIKIGSRTWFPHASDEYINKCLKKDRETTSLTIGFRICGVQIQELSGIWRPSKNQVQGFEKEEVREVLERFFRNGNGDGLILEQLKELKGWFEEQTIFHFYSASVLLIRDDGGEEMVKIVDFAHVVDGDGVIDHNFLGGLCSLIRFVAELVEKKKKKSSSSVENGYLSNKKFFISWKYFLVPTVLALLVSDDDIGYRGWIPLSCGQWLQLNFDIWI
ncbi:inositol polyphosphate multikinase IPK2-like [Wolffia australiana]